MKDVFVLESTTTSPKRTYRLTNSETNPERYLFLIERMNKIITDWIQAELKYTPADTEDESLCSFLKILNLSMLASPNEGYRSKVDRIFETNLVSTVKYRLLELDLKLRYQLPLAFIEMIEGNLYKTLCAYKKWSGLPSMANWSDLVTKYPFAWLLFPMQDILRRS